MSDYERIAKALAYLQERVTEQPSLDELAAHLHLSPFHCQRLFTRWAGTTPKRFLQVVTLELGKNLLDQSCSVLETSAALGLSSTSRLYDHFVQLEAVTPGEYKNRGAGMLLSYGVSATPLGRMLLAQTPRGICKAAFVESEEAETHALLELQQLWPLANLQLQQARADALSAQIFSARTLAATPLSVHVQGTNFQLAVWRALLQVPRGSAVSYSQIAAAVGSPSAARATGTAIGANPVAVLIPCHRVIQQSGALGGYRWGTERKLALQAWERIKGIKGSE